VRRSADIKPHSTLCSLPSGPGSEDVAYSPCELVRSFVKTSGRPPVPRTISARRGVVTAIRFLARDRLGGFSARLVVAARRSSRLGARQWRRSWFRSEHVGKAFGSLVVRSSSERSARCPSPLRPFPPGWLPGGDHGRADFHGKGARKSHLRPTAAQLRRPGQETLARPWGAARAQLRALP
jgi:hypothetical protein